MPYYWAAAECLDPLHRFVCDQGSYNIFEKRTH